jgi:hypothetical protein
MLPKQFILWGENKTCSLRARKKKIQHRGKEKREIKFP